MLLIPGYKIIETIEPVLLMEDPGWKSLQELLLSTKLELIFFLQVAIQLSTILGELHQHNIIHKDINPKNIIINLESQQVKLTGFSQASEIERETQTISNPRQLSGTLAYMSPEQTGRLASYIDYRTDFYSLGVTFYEMLTGQLPFRATDAMELIHCHIAKQPVPPHQLVPEIAPVVSAIVMKLLAKTAEDRYQNACGVRADLEDCLTQLQTSGKISEFPLGRQDVSDKLQIPQKLYGRESEVAQLLATFERVSNGTTEMMLVVGYSGGKSALVNEIHKPILGARAYFISGKFEQFKRNIPYAPLTQAFSELMRQLLTESFQALQVWKQKVLEAVGNNGQVIVDVIPEVELIIGKQPAVPILGAAESENRFKLVFQKFIGVFTTIEHPLVLFLDDLQWADSATLTLIELLICDRDSQYMLLIGAYRDNEVNLTHPLIKTVDEIQKAGIAVNTICVRSLNLTEINQLIADTLKCNTERSRPLAELVYKKTHGNPFFLMQLLKTIYQEKLLSYDIGAGEWQWDVSLISRMGISDNVVELMVGKIQKLNKNTQQILKLAACIGNRFNLEVLSLVNEKSLSATAAELWEALQVGLILPMSDAYKIPMLVSSYVSPSESEEDFSDSASALAEHRPNERLTIEYKFLRERVQQAAYSLIPADKKKEVHLKVGQVLLKNTIPEQQKEKIFDIVNHLNIGRELSGQQSERDELARLNLIAGQKAKTATAYSSAVSYLTVGLELLASDSWSQNYELTLALYRETVEAEYLNTNFSRARVLADVALQQVTTILDRVAFYELKIKVYIALNEIEQVLNLGMSALAMLEVPLEEELPKQLNIENQLSLPEMTAPYIIAAMEILITIQPPACIANHPIGLPTILTMVKLSSQYGNSPQAAYAYGIYGALLIGPMADIDSGYAFFQLSLRLLDKFDAKQFKCKLYSILGANILHWKNHVRETIELLREAIESGLSVGDIEFACHAALFYCDHSFYIGENLQAVAQKQEQSSNFIHKFNQSYQESYIRIGGQLVLNLLCESDDKFRLVGDRFNELESLPHFLELNNVLAIFKLYLAKLLLCYLFKDYEAAIENARAAESYTGYALSLMSFGQYIFYYSLALLAQYPHASNTEQQEYMAVVAQNQKRMQQWIDRSPANYQHKYDLVEAEINRVLGNPLRAMSDYDCPRGTAKGDRAIAGAREQGYIQEEALALERAAEFYLALGRERIARNYMTEAYEGYVRWGATAKVRDLKSRYQELISPFAAQPSSQNTSTTLDLATLTLTDLKVR